MQSPLKVAIRGMAPSPTLEDCVAECATKLEKANPRIVSCDVRIEPCGHHRAHGRLYAVKVEVRAPGKPAVVSHQEHEDVFVAARNAFDSIRRTLARD